MIHELSLCLVGQVGVGKSALVCRWACTGTFIENYDPSIEDSFRKQAEVDGRTWILRLEDTVVQSPDDPHLLEHCNWDSYLLVFSITDPVSLDFLTQAYMHITKGQTKQVPCVLVGHKSDLAPARVVPAQAGQAWTAARAGLNPYLAYVEASAKTPRDPGVEAAFATAIQLGHRHRSDTGQDLGQPRSRCTLL